MTSVLRVVAKVVNAIPGKKTFGVYRVLPFVFVAGATLEYVMIHWISGSTNFYKTFRKRQAEKQAIIELLENKEITVDFLIERRKGNTETDS